MKMFKKLMAVVLTGVMAISMLTGCAVTDKFVENAAKDAMKDFSAATFSSSSKKEDTDVAKAARTKLVNWAKEDAHKKTAPTQDIVDELMGVKYDASFSFPYYILIDYSTSKSTVKGSIDSYPREILKQITSDYKVTYVVSDSFSAAKKNDSSSKKDYALLVLTKVEKK